MRPLAVDLVLLRSTAPDLPLVVGRVLAAVLERSLGSDRAAEIIGRLSTVIERRPFEFLRRTPADHIVTFLRSESSQTVALVVANLHTTLAAQVLSCLPEEQQADIALRIARMGETPSDVVREIENVMRRKLETVVQQEYSAAGGVKSLAEILNHTDRPTERNVLDTIAEQDSELGEEVRRLLFVFEDIARLDDRSIQLVLREVDQRDLALAERVLDVVRGALRRLAERRRVTVLVHPDDLELVRGAAEGFAGELGGIEHCEVQAERRLARGGAVVRTDEGQVDASIETQLMRARELVAAELGS